MRVKSSAAKTISILGCGWMGLPLARNLHSQGWSVRGSTTDLDKLGVLESEGIDPFLIQANPYIKNRDVASFFNSPIIFLNIPFRRNLPDPEYYLLQIRDVIQRAQAGKVEWIVFASSTSVYPNTLVDASEDSVFIPDTERSRVLCSIEQDLLRVSNLDATVIRYAGLFGPGRLIGKFLCGRKQISGGDSPVNLIHQDDAVGMTVAVLSGDCRGEIFNVCADSHPSRRELYTEVARLRHLEPPEFLDDNPLISVKIVSNHKIKQRFGYVCLHPNPLAEIKVGG